MPIIYNKLVRDKIPEVIKQAGRDCKTEYIKGERLQRALVQKLKEETAEFEENPCVEELADLLEVIDGLCHFYGWSMEDILAVKAEKRQARGGFEKGIVLLETD